MRRSKGAVLMVLGGIAGLSLSSIAFSQSTDNKEVKDKKEKAPDAQKPPEEKRKLKGAFKGQPIETPQGQSLSDVVDAARAAREQKQQAKEQGKPKPPTISNTDLKSKAAPAATPAPTQPAPSAPPAAPATAPATSYHPTDLEGHDEGYWHQKAQAARDRVTTAREAAAAADAEAKKQENDFYSWDDGQYRDNVIKPAWDRAKEALETARKELADAEEALKNLEDDARKAGALPGWIR